MTSRFSEARLLTRAGTLVLLTAATTSVAAGRIPARGEATSAPRQLFAFVQTSRAAPSPYEKLLSVADVEGGAGIKGLKLVPRDPLKGAGGDLNFARADGTLLLMVTFGPQSLFAQWKAQQGFARAAVSGIGDEAVEGPAGVPAPYLLAFRKGNHAVSLAGFLDTDLKPRLSQEQLRALATIILSRL